MSKNVFEEFANSDADSTAYPKIDFSNTELKPIRIKEGIQWADAARENGIKILSERKLNHILFIYNPMEYSYVSPHTGKIVWAYVRTLSGPDSDQDDGVYASRQLTDAEVEQAWKKASKGQL